MASRQPERCIPHVQEVFGATTNNNRKSSSSSCNGGEWKPETTTTATTKKSGSGSDVATTERELKYIEKRMSMKKTIRKQISRQLAQAFVENPELTRNRDNNGGRLDCNRNDRNAHNLTLTKSRVLAKVDANFLDLLRRNEDVTPTIDAQIMTTGSPQEQGDAHPSQQDASSRKPSLWKRLWSTNKR